VGPERAGPVRIRRLEPDEWEAFREIRLAALQDAPYAFGSTHQAEVGLDERSWRARLCERARFVAEQDGRIVGTVGAGAGERKGSAALTALWVEPEARRVGVGAVLVRTVMDWSRDEGHRTVLLWVTAENPNAERLYERLGFKRTGAVARVRPGEPRLEYEMVASV
jgi:GNAT superfamily N-acetyltransferase